MKLWIIPLMLLALFAALMAHEDAASAFGVGREGKGMGKLGVINRKGSSGGGGTCTATGLFFNVPCNSQYIALIH